MLVNKKIAITIYTPDVSSGSDYLLKWFPGAEIVKNPRLSMSLIKRHTHILYYGGGIFFDYNAISLQQLIRRNVSLVKLFAIPKLICKVQIAGIGIGLGPFATRRAEMLCKRRLKYFSFLNVRDEYSKEIAKGWGLKNVTLAPDLSFASALTPGNKLNVTGAVKKTGKNILICPRAYPHGANKNTYVNNLLEVTKELISTGYNVTVFAFQSNHDEKILEEFAILKAERLIWNPDKMSIDDVFKIFATNDYVITARMHGIFVAGLVNTPSIGIGVHPKLAHASKFFRNSITVNDLFSVNDILSNLHKLSAHSAIENNNEVEIAETQEQYAKMVEWLMPA